MRKTLKGFLLIGVLITMGLGIFTLSGCSRSDYYTNRVFVTTCRESFLAGEITVERFNWNNVKRIEDSGWIESSNNIMLHVYLIRHGESRARAAVEHFNTLDFVLSAYLEPREKPSIA